MHVDKIDLPSAKGTQSHAAKQVRSRAPKLLAAVIKETRVLERVSSIEELRPEQIEVLAGGVDAATYLVNLPGHQVVIKLASEGLKAEAEAIEVWRKRRVKAPRVLRVGVVPGTEKDQEPVEYLMQAALLDSNGRLVETCASYLTREPYQARKVGRALGHELNKLHSCVSGGKFGELKDAENSGLRYDRWNDYVVSCIKQQHNFLKSIGTGDKDIRRMIYQASRHKFIKRGRYLHGDFSVRNVAIKSYEPLKISIFDPNPVIGDPVWDVSFINNNYEFEKRQFKYDESRRDLCVKQQQLWIGFNQGYERQINQRSLLFARFIQGIYQAQYTLAKKDKLGHRVRKEFLIETVAELVNYA